MINRLLAWITCSLHLPRNWAYLKDCVSAEQEVECCAGARRCPKICQDAKPSFSVVIFPNRVVFLSEVSLIGLAKRPGISGVSSSVEQWVEDRGAV